MQGKTEVCGRPVGSTNGRTPAGGYPSVSAALGPLLAGFIEGEGCFSITHQTRGPYGCKLAVCVRDDDAALLRELKRATALGTLRPVKARAGSRAQVTWVIQAKADCLRLVELLDRYPLRGRKSRDYAIWRAAACWWIGVDPAARPSGRDWAPMEYLKLRLHECKRYQPSRSAPIDSGPQGLTAEWSSYLSGFATAEGCFSISHSAAARFQPVFQLKVRRDDMALLSELRDRTECGRIYQQSGWNRSSPSTSWMVFSQRDLGHLCRVFDRFPPRGRKRREYEIWREAVHEYAKAGPRAPIHERLRELRSQLAEERAYSPPRPS